MAKTADVGGVAGDRLKSFIERIMLIRFRHTDTKD